MQHCYPFPRPMVTVDIVCIAGVGGTPKVLLIQRGHDPFEGHWALPGGYVDAQESLEEAASRELSEETGLSTQRLEQFRAYGDPGRDPRGHTITIVFVATFDEPPAVTGSDDAAAADWFSVADLPPLAFDHATILDDVLKHRHE